MFLNANMQADAARAELEAHYDLEPSDAAMKATAEIYEPLRATIPEPDWMRFAPFIREINRVKVEKDAVILAHNYMTPEIFHGVSDVAGDSLQLAIEATKVAQQTIIQCGVHFMAETSKILNPAKTVLIPDSRAGCSLASSITAADIAKMRAEYPGAQVVSYVNTTAEVKAASDICCTSSNALAIVEAQPGDTVIMTPDGYLAQNIAAQSTKRVAYWQGACIVHEQFTAEELRAYRESYPGIAVIAHPECPPSVVAEADFTGSTAGMIQWVKTNRPPKVVMVTECSMASNVAAEVPETDFVQPCNICPHMKRISLENILWALHSGTEEVTVADEYMEPARRAVERMIEVTNS
ncbi:quinolinate synthase NadA [Pontivivens insulae]|uniref:Quinolinate synthase n=1 Tax=Pontivivens insulae TaxID=1639689 RepID=A0A2R8AD79_9RHOB|nr:quinolinate synthase NadA [Pontivivens insulae]RED13956.1 quinolinate synthetase [Pontivivens insulae]SPF30030.1 Quinolinate synthase A [Pontivivens insulae]